MYSHGTAAFNVLRCENDRMRKGHHPRLGRASDTDLDAVHQLMVYMRAGGLAVGRNPHARCMGGSPPHFPQTVRAAGGQWTLHGEAVTLARYSDMIPRVLDRVGGEV